ncbi:MAG: hypothetical protein CL920_00150 [Deltaproteobacteria bacterium]|nr:hypothetical protein [Deltaproteobacteria bacterium]|tara:strand:- start:28787 stop:30025 length:1239 start_codon:yes stop_codon:yes gene_type:complete
MEAFTNTLEQEEQRVSYATLAMGVTFLVQISVGVIALGVGFSGLSETANAWMGRGCLFSAVAMMCAAFGTLRGRDMFAFMGSYISITLVVGALLAHQLLLSAVHLTLCLFIVRGAFSLRRVREGGQTQPQPVPAKTWQELMVDSHLKKNESYDALREVSFDSLDDISDVSHDIEEEEVTHVLAPSRYISYEDLPEVAMTAETSEEKVAWTHCTKLTAILMNVMGVDGHFDRREKDQIHAICTRMGLPSTSFSEVFEDARDEMERPLGVLVREYLGAANAVGCLHPDLQLIYGALSVIEADGIIVEEEQVLLRQLCDLLGFAPEQIERLLGHLQMRLAKPSMRLASKLLDISESASRDALKAAYEQLSENFAMGAQLYHDGQEATRMIRRKQSVERAYHVLRSAKNTPAPPSA